MRSPGDGDRTLNLGAHESSALPVTGVAADYPAGHVVPYHRHGRHHLLYAAEGVMRVEAATGRWLVPPTTAVWLRPHVDHRLVMHSRVRVHGIFVRARTPDDLPAVDCVLHVSPLLRELIAGLALQSLEEGGTRRGALLAALFLEELGRQPPLPFHLPWPGHARVARVCTELARNPAHSGSAGEWAASLAMSPKTFHRHFHRNTGMTFGRWRQQLRLMSSMTLLLGGAPIMQVALSSGYESHSAYAVAFRKRFGASPSEFLSAARQSSMVSCAPAVPRRQ